MHFSLHLPAPPRPSLFPFIVAVPDFLRMQARLPLASAASSGRPHFFIKFGPNFFVSLPTSPIDCPKFSEVWPTIWQLRAPILRPSPLSLSFGRVWWKILDMQRRNKKNNICLRPGGWVSGWRVPLLTSFNACKKIEREKKHYLPSGKMHPTITSYMYMHGTTCTYYL